MTTKARRGESPRNLARKGATARAGRLFPNRTQSSAWRTSSRTKRATTTTRRESWKKNEGNEAKKKNKATRSGRPRLARKEALGCEVPRLEDPKVRVGSFPNPASTFARTILTLFWQKSKGHGVCGEYAYVPQGPEVAEICSPPEKAWHVTKPNTGPINKVSIARFPNPGRLCSHTRLTLFFLNQKPLRYLEDPQELKLAAAREALETEKERMAEKKAFVPMGAGRAKIGATRSVVRMGINR